MAHEGGPAFPAPNWHDNTPVGLSVRKYYAAKAMMGLIADGRTMWDNPAFQADPEAIADFAFRMADAMLTRGEK